MGQSVTRSRQWELRLQRGVTVPWENKPCANSKGHNASHECYFLHSQRASRGSFVPEIPRSSTEEPNCPSIQNLFIFLRHVPAICEALFLNPDPGIPNECDIIPALEKLTLLWDWCWVHWPVGYSAKGHFRESCWLWEQNKRTTIGLQVLKLKLLRRPCSRQTEVQVLTSLLTHHMDLDKTLHVPKTFSI